MLQFAFYQHDWKEHMDASVISHLMNQIEGKAEMTELECRGDCFDYCIHTTGVDDDIIEKIYTAYCALNFENDEWFYQRYDGDFLTLKNHEEILELFIRAKINGYELDELEEEFDLDEEIEEIDNTKSTQQYNPFIASTPYQNEEGYAWQIINEKGECFDIVLQTFTSKNSGTTLFPLHQLAEEACAWFEIKDYWLAKRGLTDTQGEEITFTNTTKESLETIIELANRIIDHK